MSPNVILRLILLVVLLPTQALIAQRTWIVDQFNGPGTDYLDLPPAVAAAAPGDIIVVRRGGYRGVTTGKPLRILASPAAVLSTAIAVVGIPAGKSFVLHGFTCAAGHRFLSNAGTVHVEAGREGSTFISDRSVIHDCGLVTFADCVLRNGVYSLRSTIAVSRSTVNGLGDVVNPTLSTPGIEAADSTVYLSTTAVRGHDSHVICRTCPFETTASPGAVLSNSRLFLDRSSSIHGGVPTSRQPGGPVGQSAIIAVNSELVLDPNAPIAGSMGAPPVVSNQPPQIRPVPGLAARGAPPSGLLTTTLTGPPGAPALLALSNPIPHTVPSPFGDLALDPGSSTVVAFGAVGASGNWTLTIPIPALTSLSGTPIAFQGLVAVPQLLLTLPAAATLW